MENIVWTVPVLPLILGIIIKMGVGFVWYAPFFLGKYWMAALNIRLEDLQTAEAKKQAQLGYVIAATTAAVVSYIIGVFIQSLAITSALGVIILIILMLVGFTLPVILGRHLWENRPWRLFPIDLGYEWFSLALVALGYILL